MLRRLSILIAVFFAFSALSVVTAQVSFPGTTSGEVNMRQGPGTEYGVITTIPADAPVMLEGRNAIRTWIYLSYNGQSGWVLYRYINTGGRIQSLPIVSATGDVESAPAAEQPAADTSQPETETDSAPSNVAAPSAGPIISRVNGTSRQIFQNGQEMGNRAGVFAKVGDSIFASDLFLDPIGGGAYELGIYENLQGVINHFSQTGARDHYSFANSSIATRGGFTTQFMLDARFAPDGLCEPGESPLECEYRLIRPSVALIMLGTNDVSQLDAANYETNLHAIMDITIENGIIPVLATIPDRPNSAVSGRVLSFNNIIRRTAASYNTPLWDYWQATQGLHNQGVSEDNVHPSYNFAAPSTAAYFTDEGLRYGYNMLNLTALQALDAVWRGAMN